MFTLGMSPFAVECLLVGEVVVVPCLGVNDCSLVDHCQCVFNDRGDTELIKAQEDGLNC